MRKHKIILVITIFISGLLSAQIKDDLKQYHIADRLNKFGIKLNAYILKDDFEIKSYNQGFTITNDKDSIIIKKVRIFSKGDFFINTYKYTPTNYEKHHQEYFTIHNSNIYIDSILAKSKIKLKYNNPYFYLRESFFFKGKKKDENIILVQAENRTFYRSKYVLSYFVIKITKNKVDIYLLYDIDNGD